MTEEIRIVDRLEEFWRSHTIDDDKIPSGKQPHSYGQWPIEIDGLPILKMVDLSIAILT